MSPDPEILGPALRSKQEASVLIRAAAEHFRVARRATIQVMADLRRLQDGQVHILYGYKNFSTWASDTFPGLNPNNVRQLCRAGAIALELDKRKLIDLNDPKGVGTTGLRELATVASTYGDDKMAEIFTTAKNMIEPGEWVSSTNVEAAMRLLMPPAPVSEQAQADMQEVIDEDFDEPQYSPEIQELKDQIQDYAYDLPDSLADIKLACEQLSVLLKQEND